MAQQQKLSCFLPRLAQLQQYHNEHCNKFRAIQSLGELPITVQAFKSHLLKSVADEQVHRILKSSGTSGVQSKIVLDSHTARLQTKVLSKIMQHWLGPKRLPLLILDSKKALDLTSGMSARAAGIQGMSLFGRDHCFALDENLELNIEAIQAFAKKYSQVPVFMYGFTFIIWQKVIKRMQESGLQLNFSDVFLLHGGGWKKMVAQAVDKETFKQALCSQLGNVRVHDYYGMVEQTGTIHVECEYGMLHTPIWADIQVLNPVSLQSLPLHTQGVVQLQSILPKSYPGHNLLTEDLAIIHGVDDCKCGRKGKYFTLQGRIASAEARGCSDTFK
ncbi:acyl-protein synthetase [Pseudoalteromonas 'SMAR']|uniref:LuxE/PaaK family acyltransferase n=1 Tax=Pseudoalteromonas 'SMAR' TaxID=3416908 RepID=UPI003AF252E2